MREIQAKTQTNIFDYIKTNVNIIDVLYKLNPSGKLTDTNSETPQFNSCPICSHNDCLVIYKGTNSYKCFSASDGTGGTVIDLIINSKNVEEKDVPKIVKDMGFITEQDIQKYNTYKKKDSQRRQSKENPNQLIASNFITTEQKKQAIRIDRDDVLNVLEHASEPQNNTMQEEFNNKLINAYDFTSILDLSLNKLKADDIKSIVDFLETRGFKQEEGYSLLEKYNLYRETYISRGIYFNYLCIPVIYNNIVYALKERDMTGINNPKWKYEKISGTDRETVKIPYNLDCIEEARKDNKTLFITESELDTLSILNFEKLSIGYGGQSRKEIVNFLADTVKDLKIVSAFDNDDGGEKYHKNFIEALEQATGVKRDIIRLNLREYKDPNEFLTKDRDGFIDELNRATEQSKQEYNEYLEMLEHKTTEGTLFDYMLSDYDKDIELNKMYQNIDFGYKNINETLGHLNPLLYAMGGVSSIGKTTFAVNLALNFAKQKQHILFYSLEQTTNQMFSKMLSCLYNRVIIQEVSKWQSGDILTSIDIMEQTEKYKTIVKTDRFKQVQDEAKEIFKYITIRQRLDLKTDQSILGIETDIHNWIKRNKKRPVIFVDYLQNIKAIDREQGTQTVDNIVQTCLEITSAFHIPLFLISSFNRESYLKTVSETSFKQSGGIEYTAEVLLGLQYKAITDALDSETETENKKLTDGKDSVKRNVLQEAKEGTPREITLNAIKNRWGETNRGIHLRFYPEANVYTDGQTDPQSKEYPRDIERTLSKLTEYLHYTNRVDYEDQTGQRIKAIANQEIQSILDNVIVNHMNSNHDIVNKESFKVEEIELEEDFPF